MAESFQVNGMSTHITSPADFLKSSIHRAMSRDEARYLDPEVFLSERFLDSEGMLNEDSPANFVFGFGRRTCSGEPQHVPQVSQRVSSLPG